MKKIQVKSSVSAIDLFCGGGGLTYGLQKAGLPIKYGIDADKKCQYPFEKNTNATFICKDVSSLAIDEITSLFGDADIKILVGCAPCQPFSTYNHKNDNPDWELLNSFSKLITALLPDIVSMENVPQLIKFQGGKIFSEFVGDLKDHSYSVSFKTLYGPDFGLPQSRSRLVLLASRLGNIELPKPTHANRHRTVRDAIGKLPPIEAGETSQDDPLHRARSMSDTNLKRIKASLPGGTWRDWDEKLRAKCHTKKSGETYSSVYGRMRWDKPSPTITTQFCGFGNGRFGHPEQNRALSLREGALLQGFPKSYKFFDQKKPLSISKISQIIGNAVPVDIGKAIGKAIIHHIEEVENGGATTKV